MKAEIDRQMRAAYHGAKEYSNSSTWLINMYAELKMLGKLGIKTTMTIEPWLAEAFCYIDNAGNKLQSETRKKHGGSGRG